MGGHHPRAFRHLSADRSRRGAAHAGNANGGAARLSRPLLYRAAGVAKDKKARPLRLYVLSPDQPFVKAFEPLVMNAWLLLMKRRASSERADISSLSHS